MTEDEEEGEEAEGNLKTFHTSGCDLTLTEMRFGIDSMIKLIAVRLGNYLLRGHVER